MIPLKHLSSFWSTLKRPLINCGINLDLNWLEKCVLVATNLAAQVIIFLITDTKPKHYIPVLTLSTQENRKLLEQLKSDFKRIINWNKYQSKISTERKN